MKNPPRERPVKDERDEMIDRDSRNRSLELMICATQVLTIICAVKATAPGRAAFPSCSSASPPGLYTSTKCTGKNRICTSA